MTYGEVEMANSDALRKVLAHITDNPSEWRQHGWHACFAGWTLRLCMPGVELRTEDLGYEVMYLREDHVFPRDIRDWAASLLGLTSDQAHDLFHQTNDLAALTAFVAEFTAEKVPAPAAG